MILIHLHERFVMSTFNIRLPMIALLTTILVALSNPALANAALLSPTGFAKYSELEEDLFLTALSLDEQYAQLEDIHSNNGVRRLEFKFMIDNLSPRRFSRILIQSAAINNPSGVFEKNSAALFRLFEQFRDDFQYGDHLVIEANQLGELKTTLNSVELGRVNSYDLFNILLNVWVGDIPPTRQFKNLMLGIEDYSALETAFSEIAYSSYRMRQIQRWSTI